jgi:isopentenyl-diphosphate Delta-isomerase
MLDEVILVDEKDAPCGTMEKMEAHRKGVLHRAFSVFIFNSKGEMLLQQRAFSKYHSGGLFSNACCSHPRPGEDTLDAAHRRLKEEMGIETELHYKTSFVYRATFENGLTEHEYDPVYTGVCDDEPAINPFEVASYKWLDADELKKEIGLHPERFSYWFRMAIEKLF